MALEENNYVREIYVYKIWASFSRPPLPHPLVHFRELVQEWIGYKSTCYFDRITQSDSRCAQLPLHHKADRCESVAIAESETLTLITALTWFQLPWKNVTLNPQSQLPRIPWSMNPSKFCTTSNRRNWLQTAEFDTPLSRLQLANRSLGFLLSSGYSQHQVAFRYWWRFSLMSGIRE